MVTPLLADTSASEVLAVNLDELGNCAARMSELAGKIDEAIDQMEADVVALEEKDWRADNYQRFLTYFINQHTSLKASAAYYGAYAQALSDVKRLYEGLQDQIDGVFAE